MRNLSKKAKTIIAGAAIAGLASAGGAYAYWTTTGSGTGQATAGTTSTFTVASTNGTAVLLSPNGPTQASTFTVHNPGSGNQKLSQVVVSIMNADGVTPWASAGGCTAADFSINGVAAGNSANVAVLDLLTPNGTAGSTSASYPVTIQMVDTGSPQNGCKGVSVPLYYAAS